MSGRSYFKFVNTLKHLKLDYDSVLPEEITSSDKRLILTTVRESEKIPSNLILFDDEFDYDPTIIRGKIVEKLESGIHYGSLVIGIDPGSRIGLSVFYYEKEIESSIYTSVDDLISHIVKILVGLNAKRKVVKVGNGNMKIARQITNLLNLRFCSHFELEFVDERKTSLRVRNYNKRGERDKISARYITQREGYRHLVLPLSRIG
ncbi:MAG: hypothetical protein AUH25_01330 [Thaumarchaeota archaeon 13_1_40CM_38_12]|nr:MAG: hypothetical protein AUH25_01330 [Thaumarchaeota archaeon 13_1_40CM_38_12]OLC33877.1 MAG: hypothetical protein AUH84_06205 [Thaumarchaeota archaeon 13_1_40CM_4_38_7]OLC91363.1 MAG: hypothetical protein AUI92_07950 [Thaumarchaeota archaeon 13_1_40CM_3_38_6]OLD30949.1 MAG: hypothetical protein AUI62_00600 [Thaumarchaeota archaeon 13_1_40CM_2_39_7]TLY08115.1 MAG: pre-16S rRNA-processing nuclease YqgF [Nitrososphaerota archaeon]